MRQKESIAELQPYRTPSMFRLAAVQIVGLCVVGLIAVVALIQAILGLSVHGVSAEWIGMTVDPLIASVGCGTSLAICLADPTKSHLATTRILASAAAVPAFFELVSQMRGSAGSFETFVLTDGAPAHFGSMPRVVSVAFVLLAILLFLLKASRGIASIAADFIAFSLGLLGLIMLSGWLFTATHIFDSAYANRIPPATLFMLVLLIAIAFSVRAQYGAFNILIGSGLGSRIARALTPVLLILPFLREAGRARIIRLHLLPEHSEAAILGSLAAMISLGLLLVISRHIRRMEREIQRLSLRDELTGLNNLRGFRLLAEQGFRLANRSQTAFSVLFVDVDRLKEINDTLGHTVGSSLLVETAALLKATFRETDVVARIGGDEFAVAGQFSRAGISTAGERLAEQASRTRLEACGGRPISLSIGYATTHGHRQASLQDLLDEADLAMYENKRRKRLQVC